MKETGDRSKRFALGTFAAAGGTKKQERLIFHVGNRSYRNGHAIVKSRDAANGLFLRHRINVHPPTGPIEPDVPVDQGENRVIAPQANVFAGQKFRSALAHDDVAGNNKFVSELLYPEPFADAVPTILYAALSFFMSHC